MRKERLSELEQVFWERLADMHLEERISVLKDRRAELKENLAYGTPSQTVETEAAIIRINDEIKRVNRLLHNNVWREAIKNVFGEDGYLLVRLEAERLEGFLYMGKPYEDILADRQTAREESIAKHKGKR